MRPVRLELEGFSAYRAPTVVDFEGVDLFALTGPTGAGKSAVLDAIAFALYGVVHRLGNKAAVAPAISQGLNEARVRLDFDVGDVRWTATRVVRRTKGARGKGPGASTAEARLEGPDGVAAGTADEVTARVTEVLGLTYDHFSRCVILPQGEFARFLHDKAADRQELLVSLLELDLYGRMAERASRRAADAKGDVQGLDGQLRQLAGATDEALAEAEARLVALSALVASLDLELPVIAGLEADEDAARVEAAALAAEAERLASVVVPGDIDALATASAAAGTALAAAEAASREADAAEEAAQAVVASLPDRAEFAELLKVFDDLEGALSRRQRGESVVAEKRADLEHADKLLASASDELDASRLAAERASAAHRAHAVRADVVLGEACPVCDQVVLTLPDVAPPADLQRSTAAVAAAEASRREAETGRSAAATELTRAEVLLASVGEQIDQLEARVAARRRGDVEEELRKIAAAADALAAATAAAKAARRAEQEAREAVAGTARATAAARDRFDVARDQVAALGAPARLGGGDLAGEWAALAEWAATEAPGRRSAAGAASARADGLRARRVAALEALAGRCADAGVSVRAGESPRDAAATAAARAAAHRDTLEQHRRDAARVEAARAQAEARHDVARSLATHLDARHFEKWLLDEAVRTLAAGATELLRTLSGGHYSLTVDGKGSFVVIDHHNADESRPARTLSGGETFLASLALSLALADRIASLAAGGSARLDAIFLDEGFGSLDPDTLDVVATAIEELGAAGRMVGVVSHVAELAERVPVRFEVARTGNSSTITRVDR